MLILSTRDESVDRTHVDGLLYHWCRIWHRQLHSFDVKFGRIRSSIGWCFLQRSSNFKQKGSSLVHNAQALYKDIETLDGKHYIPFPHGPASESVQRGRLQRLHEAPDGCLNSSLQGWLRAAHFPGLAVHHHMAVANLGISSICLLTSLMVHCNVRTLLKVT